MVGHFKHKANIGMALVLVFLFTAIVLPIVSPLELAKKTLGVEIKASDFNQKKSDQLPPTETESEEEENLSKKDSGFSISFIVGSLYDVLFFLIADRLNTLEAISVPPSSIPIYLAKRALLI
jgi:hypothetical protein